MADSTKRDVIWPGEGLGPRGYAHGKGTEPFQWRVFATSAGEGRRWSSARRLLDQHSNPYDRLQIQAFVDGAEWMYNRICGLLIDLSPTDDPSQIRAFYAGAEWMRHELRAASQTQQGGGDMRDRG